MAVIPESSSKHEYITMPSDCKEIGKLAHEVTEKKDVDKKELKKLLLLEYIANSASANRNSCHTFCMLMGESGSGKTSTLNHLLGVEIPTSDKRSSTTSVNAYTSEHVCEELQVNRLRLTVVDTPGLNDTRGLDQDACNMYAVKKFCDENIQCDDTIRYPNVILLCVKATDNRIDDDQSSFVKSLRALNSLHVIDTEKPNVVIAVTHACSLPHKDIQRFIDKKDKIKAMYQEVAQTTLKIDVPVVFIENNYEEQQLEAFGNQETFLPNNEIQPRNLFQAIIENVQENEDEIALMTLREAYRAGSNTTFYPGNSVAAKIAKKEILRKGEKQCKQLLLQNSEVYESLKKQHEQKMEQLERQMEAKLKLHKIQMSVFLEKQEKDQETAKGRAQLGQNKQQEGREGAANSVPLRKSRNEKFWIAVGVGCTILVVAGVVALCVFCPPAGAATTTAVAAEGAAAAGTGAAATAAGTGAAATAAGTGAAATVAGTGAAATAAETGAAATGAVIVGATAVLVNVGKK